MVKKNNSLKEQCDPILIYTDEAQVRTALHKLEEIIIPAVRKVKQTFDKLQMGPFTNTRLKDLLSAGIRNVEAELRAQIEKETPLRFLKDEAIRASRKQLSFVSEALDDLNSRLDAHAIYDLLEYPSVNEKEEIVLTEKAVQAIREANSIYVTSPKAKELYEAHKTAAAALDQFYQMIKAEVTSNSIDLARLFTVGEDDNRVKPEVFDYEYSEYVTGKVRNFV